MARERGKKRTYFQSRSISPKREESRPLLFFSHDRIHLDRVPAVQLAVTHFKGTSQRSRADGEKTETINVATLDFSPH